MTITHLYRLKDPKLQYWYRRQYLDEDDPLLQNLAEFRVGLFDQGYEVIPCRGKSGLLNGFTSGPITPERVRDETHRGTEKLNTSIRTGFTVGVDNDLRDPIHAAAADEITEHILGPTPLKRYGSKGAMWIYRNETPIKKLTITAEPEEKDKPGVRLFEILGDGQQFVGFGHHPDGMDYRWDGDDPTTVRWADLPEVTPEQLERLRATQIELLTELGYKFKSETPRQKAAPVDKPKRTRAFANHDEDIPALCRAALAVIPNDLNREEWIAFCCAMRDRRAEFAYADFADWSRSYPGNTEAVMRRTWDSCSNPRSATFLTILHHADRNDPTWRSRYWWANPSPGRQADWDEQEAGFRAQIAQENDTSDEPQADGEQQEGVTQRAPEEASHAEKRKRFLTYFDEYANLPEPEYWDEERLLIRKPDGTIILLLGKRGSHKTNLALLLAMEGMVKKNAKIVYIANEGQFMLGKKRIIAYCDAFGIDVKELRGRFEYRPEGILLTDPKGAPAFIQGCEADGMIPDIVFIDTYGQATTGVDSNSSLKGDLFADNGPIALIKKRWGCIVIVLAHPPQHNARKVVGHTGVEDNSEMLLLIEQDKEQGTVMVTVDRDKNGPEGGEHFFRPEPGTDGIPVLKRVAAPVEQPAMGLQRRVYEEDEGSKIRFACSMGGKIEYTNQEMAEQLFKYAHTGVTDPIPEEDRIEWITDKLNYLKRVQQRLDRKPNAPFRSLCSCVVVNGKNQWKWSWTGASK